MHNNGARYKIYVTIILRKINMKDSFKKKINEFKELIKSNEKLIVFNLIIS